MSDQGMLPWAVWGREGGATLVAFAYHEAAHAVCYWQLTGRSPVSVTVALDEEFRALTRLPRLDTTADDETFIRSVLAEIVTARCGLAADQRRGQGHWARSMLDLRRSSALAESLFGRSIAETVIRRADGIARELVHDAWAAIEAVAWRLLEPPYRLDGDEIEAAIPANARDAAWYWRPVLDRWAEGAVVAVRYLLNRESFDTEGHDHASAA